MDYAPEKYKKIIEPAKQKEIIIGKNFNFMVTLNMYKLIIMYSKSLLIIFIISIFAFTSCVKSDIIISEDSANSIKIELKDVKIFDYNSIVEEINYVALETTDESLIGNIEKIILYDKNIIIFDRQTNKILLFSHDGSFIRQIGQRGQGPDEYNTFNEIFLDEPSGLIYAHERIKNVMFVYNLEGKIVHKIHPRFRFNSFCKTKDGFWLYTCFENNNPNGYNLMLVDERMQKMIRGFFPQHPNFINVEFGKSRFYNNEAGEFFFSYPTSNCIYKLSDQSPEAIYKIDFGNKTAPYREIAKLETSEEYYKLMENDYFKFRDYCFWNNILIFSFSESSLLNAHSEYKGFYEINNSNLNIYKGFINSKTIPSVTITGTSGFALIFNKYPFEMMSDQREYIEKQLDEKLDDDSNPVLIICYPKKN